MELTVHVNLSAVKQNQKWITTEFLVYYFCRYDESIVCKVKPACTEWKKPRKIGAFFLRELSTRFIIFFQFNTDIISKIIEHLYQVRSI